MLPHTHTHANTHTHTTACVSTDEVVTVSLSTLLLLDSNSSSNNNNPKNFASLFVLRRVAHTPSVNVNQPANSKAVSRSWIHSGFLLVLW